MEENQFDRTALLLGKASVERLARKRVAVFGVGGVGGFVCEGLVRAGIGAIDIVDKDIVAISNINRQLIALHSTVGKNKVDVLEERLKDINKNLIIKKYKCFFLPETSETFDFREYDYVVDAIDTVTGKIELILKAKEAGVPIISAMGAGNKLDPAAFQVSDIYKTSVCPLARVMRRELKKRGVDKLKVVYSKEEPIKPQFEEGEEVVPGSISFVPPALGLIIAGEVVKDLIRVE
ncbi:tRNA threonylcarbamoyladenosine dehydratase [Catonella massiliensis]|uniref:tRNA threonylcarbamoyladenosine dehydratase n=1 Tax=Catonella massiliensis TaxID=2799636 RepID=A0ABS1IX41_9FIRM|nr:tRNA threonylcarbamoyladenosine dehydratase [Catonella massiliensis]MBK5896385.1 tRNA threonylcarbamoyladenosine dehydratase [Catonella massiliensis]